MLFKALHYKLTPKAIHRARQDQDLGVFWKQTHIPSLIMLTVAAQRLKSGTSGVKIISMCDVGELGSLAYIRSDDIHRHMARMRAHTNMKKRWELFGGTRVTIAWLFTPRLKGQKHVIGAGDEHQWSHHNHGQVLFAILEKNLVNSVCSSTWLQSVQCTEVSSSPKKINRPFKNDENANQWGCGGCATLMVCTCMILHASRASWYHNIHSPMHIDTRTWLHLIHQQHSLMIPSAAVNKIQYDHQPYL